MQAVAPTIPVAPRVVLMRVTTHNWNGEKHTTPFWHILGYQDRYESNRRWFNMEDVTLGDMGDGDHILDVGTLGLDPTECIAYLDAEESHTDLQTEEDRYDLHSDPDGKCLCPQIARERAIMDLYESKITEAVNARFDAWTRRRHLVALAESTGMLAPSNYPNLQIALAEPVVCDSPTVLAYKTASDWLSAP
jgi:hypothetical protein